MNTDRRLRKWQTAGVLGMCGLAASYGSRVLIAPAQAQTPKTAALEVGENGPLTDEQKIVHVLNRLGYGPRPGDIERVKAMGIGNYIDQQLHPEMIPDTAVASETGRLSDAFAQR